MKSEFLTDLGIKNYIAGIEYDFKYKKVGDKVKEYIEEILEENNLYPENIYTGRQTHSLNVKNVEDEEGKEEFVYGNLFDNTDGLLTDKKNNGILIKYADCTPIIFYDKKKKILGAVHSGWRGTAGRISEVMINKLKADFDSKSEDIYCYIGPTVDFELYEVGLDVYEQFSRFKDRNKYFKRKSKEKFFLDMKGINKSILLENGILEENIEVAKENTISDKRFHSARRDGENYGLNMIFVMM